MSFEVYLQAFKDGEEFGFSPDQIRSAFRDCLAELEPDFWQVRFGNSESSDLFLGPASDGSPLIHSISVHRPCTDPRLWDGLFALLEVPGSVFYFPGGSAPLARDLRAAEAMPADMRESLGEPVHAESPGDLSRAVASA